jgi:hypothetical protein
MTDAADVRPSPLFTLLSCKFSAFSNTTAATTIGGTITVIPPVPPLLLPPVTTVSCGDASTVEMVALLDADGILLFSHLPTGVAGTIAIAAATPLEGSGSAATVGCTVDEDVAVDVGILLAISLFQFSIFGSTSLSQFSILFSVSADATATSDDKSSAPDATVN